MRAGARSVALVALGTWTFACAVYQADQIPLESDRSPPASAGGSAAGSGGQDSQAGTAAPAGRAGNEASGGASGGVPSAPEEHGGESAGGGAEDGGESSGGSASGGSAGVGGGGGASGSAGVSGSGGTSGSAGTSGSGGSEGGTSGSAGSGGSGGGVTAPSCDDHPLSASSSWTASASHDNSGTSPASNVLDGKQSRWTTGKPQSGDEWLQIDFGRVVTLSHVNLQQGNVDTNDYPRSYAVIVSDTTKDLSAAPRVTGIGKSGVSTPIALPALATGRYLLIKQLGSSLSWWSTQEVEVACAN